MPVCGDCKHCLVKRGEWGRCQKIGIAVGLQYCMTPTVLPMSVRSGGKACPDFKPRELCPDGAARGIHHKKKASPGAQSILKLDEASAGLVVLKGMIAEGRREYER